MVSTPRYAVRQTGGLPPPQYDELFTSIQAALDTTEVGDIVEVLDDATYSENIRMPPGVELHGAGPGIFLSNKAID